MPSCLAKAVTRCRRLFPRRVCAECRARFLGAFASAHPNDNVAGRNHDAPIHDRDVLERPWPCSPRAPQAQTTNWLRLQKDPKQWVMPTGDFANTRYSALKQITAENVGKLQVAWTFSTGVLRGHEGDPLVIGDMMYRPHAVPEHRLCARPEGREQDHLEVRAEAGSERHSGDVLRHGQSRRRLCGRQDLPASGRHDASSRSTRRPARSSGR